MASKIFNLAAGYSDSESDVDEFGLMTLVKSRKKKRKSQPQPSTSKINADESVPKSFSTGPTAKKKKPTFWEKKERAFEKFGEATLRPQDCYRNFLLHRRKINKGENDDKWLNHPMASTISQTRYRPPETSPMPRQLYDNQLILVNDKNNFMRMMNHLNSVEDMAIDLEANDEHSYLGMTVLIQIGTTDYDFIIDCFPVTDIIINELSVILQNQQIMKYLFGCDNDVLWLQRDFSIFLCSAIDVQLLIQLMLQKGMFDEMTSFLPFEQRKAWYHKYIGPRKQTTPEKDRLLWEKAAGEQGMSYEKIVELYYPELQIDKDAQQADFRPRNENDAQYKQLIQYARDDVHALLQIVQKIQLQFQGRKPPIFDDAFAATKKKLLNKYKRKTYPTSAKFMEQSGDALDVDKRDLACMIYQWRDEHSRIIDESPSSMFTDKQLLDIVKKAPLDESELEQRVKSRLGRTMRIPESIQTWKTCLFNLIVQGQPYYEKIASIQCHNCRNIGHAAWGCSEDWSIQNTKKNLRENDLARARQNHRRQRNKRRNKQLRRLNEQKD